MWGNSVCSTLLSLLLFDCNETFMLFCIKVTKSRSFMLYLQLGFLFARKNWLVEKHTQLFLTILLLLPLSFIFIGLSSSSCSFNFLTQDLCISNLRLPFSMRFLYLCPYHRLHSTCFFCVFFIAFHVFVVLSTMNVNNAI